MASTSSQKKASAAHRKRAAARGLVRIEVQAAGPDAELIRHLARTLRDDRRAASALRRVLQRELQRSDAETALDLFQSDLPDSAFDGVFDQPRETRWRATDL